jgi:PEP-CTERM motif
MTRELVQRTSTKVAAALALLVAASAADATPITVDFSVTSNDVSNPSYGAGVVGTGYFTFDDSLIPAGGSGHIGNPIVPLPTLDFFFSWFGVSFDESNAAIATLTFADGVLSDWMIGGSYLPATCGFLRYACTSSGGAAPDFGALGSGGAALTDARRPGLAHAHPVQWSVRATEVPEPGTLALFGLGAAGLAFARRRRMAGASEARP